MKKRSSKEKWISKLELPLRSLEMAKSLRSKKTARKVKIKLELQPQPYVAKHSPKLLKAKKALVQKIRKRLTARRGKQLSSKEPLDVENIVAVSIGEKVTQGKRTRKPALIIHVREKCASGVAPEARIEKMIPKKRYHVLTDVRAAGDIVAHAIPAGGGSCMYHFNDNKGTAACVVSTPVAGGGREYGFLGCNHSFAACNTVAIDSFIYHQWREADGTEPEVEIGRLRRFHSLDFRSTARNQIDCALAATLPEFAGLDIEGIGSIEPEPLAGVKLVGRQVVKYGAATGLTYGIIRDDDVSATINYTIPTPQKAHFTNLLRISPLNVSIFSAGGDSGALIVDVLTRKPVGIVIAGDTNASYGCHISKVLSALNARIEC